MNGGRAGFLARRLAWPVVFTVVVGAVLGFGVLPTRSYLDRREQVAAAEARLTELEHANAQAREQRDRLQTDAEVERLAREHYGLVREGEEAYQIVPPPQPPAPVPDVWPFERLNRSLGGAGAR
jgi:cell division protein FtsB